MKPYYADDWLTVYAGDCRLVMASLPADSVDCVVTSPPYWGLRDYGNDGQLGLERTPEEYVANMVAVFREVRRVLKPSGTCWLNLGDSYAASGAQGPNSGLAELADRHAPRKNPRNPNRDDTGSVPRPSKVMPAGLKPKDLVGIPWRVAFALQADGWYLRSDIVWAKPNPMPESVTDRPTKSHEMLFLLTKGEWVSRVVQLADLDGERLHLLEYLRSEGKAVRPATRLVCELASAIFDRTEREERFSLPPLYSQVWQEGASNGYSDLIAALPVEHRAAIWAASFLTANSTAKEFLEQMNRLWVALPDGGKLLDGWQNPKVTLAPSVDANGETTVTVHDAGQVGEFKFGGHLRFIIRRPSRSSYYFDADAVREAQRDDEATFYVKLIKQPHKGQRGKDEVNDRHTTAGLQDATYNPAGRNIRSVWTIATRPYPGAHFAVFPPELPERCIKAGSPENGLVFDPFAGSGTVGMVANRLSRRAILIDLNPEYLKQQMRRNAQTPLGLAEPA